MSKMRRTMRWTMVVGGAAVVTLCLIGTVVMHHSEPSVPTLPDHRDTIRHLRDQLAATNAERDATKRQIDETISSRDAAKLRLSTLVAERDSAIQRYEKLVVERDMIKMQLKDAQDRLSTCDHTPSRQDKGSMASGPAIALRLSLGTGSTWSTESIPADDGLVLSGVKELLSARIDIRDSGDYKLSIDASPILAPGSSELYVSALIDGMERLELSPLSLMRSTPFVARRKVLGQTYMSRGEHIVSFRITVDIPVRIFGASMSLVETRVQSPPLPPTCPQIGRAHV